MPPPFDPIEPARRPLDGIESAELLQGCTVCGDDRRRDAGTLPFCSFCDPDFESWLMSGRFGLSRLDSR